MSTDPRTSLGTVTIPNNAALIPALLRYAEHAAGLARLAPRDVHRLQLALEEACSDVMKHSFTAGEHGAIDVRFVQRLDSIEVRIHDMGLPFDPSQIPAYDPQAGIDRDFDGIGSFLISQMVDEYQFNNLGKEGKEVVLVKYVASQNIAEDAPPPASIDADAAPPPAKGEAGRIQFDIRRMQDHEAVEVCRCIYDCYGYSYANENVYYPERLAAMNQEGRLHSVVAVAQDGEVGGHFANIYYDHLPAEAGICVTKKKFRGQGFARLLGERLLEEAGAQGLRGLQIRQVTSHPYTQKFCAKLGYKDCGVLLAHSPKSLSFKGIADQLRQRNSDVLGFQYLAEPAPIAIYAPENHRVMIEKLFGNIGVEVRHLEADDPRPAETHTAMHVNVNTTRSLAEIGVAVCGQDILPFLRQQLRKLFLDEIQVIEFYLSLDDPMTAALVPQLEAIGFRFTGVLPETAYGNAVVLQYLNGVHIDYDDLVLVSDAAQELVAYIREHDAHHVELPETEGATN